MTVPIDLGIWQTGQRLDLHLDEPTPVGVFLGDLVRLLGLPRRAWDGQPIDYWLHPRDDGARLDETVNLNEVEVSQSGLVLAASQSALDIRVELDRLVKGINLDIRKAIDEEIERGIGDVTTATTGEFTAVIRDVREQVTRRVTDLIPTGREGVKAQFLAAVRLRKMARTDALVEYQDAVELGLGRAKSYARGAWRTFSGLAAHTGAAGVAGTAAAAAAVVLVAAVPDSRSQGRGRQAWRARSNRSARSERDRDLRGDNDFHRASHHHHAAPAHTPGGRWRHPVGDHDYRVQRTSTAQRLHRRLAGDLGGQHSGNWQRSEQHRCGPSADAPV